MSFGTRPAAAMRCPFCGDVILEGPSEAVPSVRCSNCGGRVFAKNVAVRQIHIPEPVRASAHPAPLNAAVPQAPQTHTAHTTHAASHFPAPVKFAAQRVIWNNSANAKPPVPGRMIKTTSKFEAVPAQVLAMCCCDGRYISATQEFLFAQGVERHDLIAFPGGPALLTLQSSSASDFMAATHAFDLMAGLHASKQAVLIAHSDCAYYLSRYQVCDVTRQKNDLRRAATQLAAKHADLKISLYYATPVPDSEGSGVLFEEIAIK